MEGSVIIPSCAAKEEPVSARAGVPAAGIVRSRKPIGLIVHVALWGSLAVALVGVSVAQLVRETSRGRFGPAEPGHSINRYLWGMNEAGRAEELRKTFAALPQDRSVVILMREDGGSSLAGVAISYLAWPRRVQMISCSDAVAEQRLATIRPNLVAAVVFCNVNPPSWFPQGSLCAPDVRIVCLQQTEPPQ